jgi:hypothetical protein
MRTPPGVSSSGGSTGAASPALIVILFLALGAIVYLRRSKYIRRKTAYISVAIVGAVLVLTSLSLYQSGR